MKLPCEDCITLAICKNIQTNKHSKTYINMALVDKCSLLKEFIYSYRILGNGFKKVADFLDKTTTKGQNEDSL